MVQRVYTPLQVVHVAVAGQFHVFQFSRHEPLQLPVEFEDLPWDDVTDQMIEANGVVRPLAGFDSLQRFIRFTLNYHSSVCYIASPDGQIETVRYLGGLDSFREAEGRSQRAMRWTGTLHFGRFIYA
jgi:hypothetical protein